MTDPVASLARSPSGSGEPVAWQKRDKDNPWHSIEDCSDENLYALESAYPVNAHSRKNLLDVEVMYETRLG